MDLHHSTPGRFDETIADVDAFVNQWSAIATRLLPRGAPGTTSVTSPNRRDWAAVALRAARAIRDVDRDVRSHGVVHGARGPTTRDASTISALPGLPATRSPLRRSNGKCERGRECSTTDREFGAVDRAQPEHPARRCLALTELAVERRDEMRRAAGTGMVPVSQLVAETVQLDRRRQMARRASCGMHFRVASALDRTAELTGAPGTGVN